jgi:hypothetical protein
MVKAKAHFFTVYGFLFEPMFFLKIIYRGKSRFLIYGEGKRLFNLMTLGVEWGNFKM